MMQKILVVDDEDGILELVDATLREGAQYEILLPSVTTVE